MKKPFALILAGAASGVCLLFTSCYPVDEGPPPPPGPAYGHAHVPAHSHPEPHHGIAPGETHVHAHGVSKNHLRKPTGFPTFASAINNRHRRTVRVHSRR